MKAMRLVGIILFLLTIIALTQFTLIAAPQPPYDPNPPFKPDLLKPVSVKDRSGKNVNLFDPRDPYAIFINYELGMHCVGFDISYCCVIPPYNSIQAQAVRTSADGALPHLLSPDDGLSLAYFIKDNSYSEGNKMRYWQVPKDVVNNGRMDEPGDSMANYVWTHLFIYKDLEGTIPQDRHKARGCVLGWRFKFPLIPAPRGRTFQAATSPMREAPAATKSSPIPCCRKSKTCL